MAGMRDGRNKKEMLMSTLIELFGYLGSALVVISMLMSSVIKLRVINTIGSVISGAYALIIGSFPLALMNFCLIIINVYNLYRLLVTRNRYDLLRCQPGDAFVNYFVDCCQKDMELYFPGFRETAGEADCVYAVFCNAAPAGILLGKTIGEGTVQVYVDYSTPMHRDCSIGNFLHSRLPGEGVHTLIMEEASEKHVKYLEKMGYRSMGDRFVIELK